MSAQKPTTGPCFKVSPEDAELITSVFKRAINAGLVEGERLSAHMDLTAAHTSFGLDLRKLLDAPRFDFAHDVCGIFANMNRRTGRLDNHFMPRCAANAKAAA